MNEDIKQLFKFLTTVFSTREYSKASEQINGLFQFNIKCGQFELNNDDMILPTEKLLKIGVLLILCFSAFMMNFNTYHKKVHYDESKVSKDYEKDVKEKKALNHTQYGTIVPQETIEYPSFISNDSFQNLDIQSDSSSQTLNGNFILNGQRKEQILRSLHCPQVI